MSTANDIRTDIAECEKRIARLERTWHLHNSHYDRENAASALSGLVQYVARQREELAEVEAAERATQDTVDQLTAVATRSGNPAAVAVAHVVSGVAADSNPVADEPLHAVPVDEPLYGPAARAMRDALRKTTAHTGDSDVIDQIRHEDDELGFEAEPEQQLPVVSPYTARKLIAVAHHLTEHRPTQRMTEVARMTVVLRTAGSAAAARPVLHALPFPSGGVSRGEYGRRVLAQVGGAL
ncbi:hypothetical protein ACFYXM_08865 [Streptomyces sp. NPDC002476]|uniref:hypothetical protein n=1 Tax=Streptomyces sp. NPDC002476 TaxID=3364648 RepID=UPI0036CFEF25